MTLSELLPTLAGNTNLYITLVDGEGDEMITFNAPGYASIEGDLGAYTVSAISVNGAKAVGITVAAPE